MAGAKIVGDLERLKRTLSNLSFLELEMINQVIGDALVSSTGMRFRNEQDPEGNSWKTSVRAAEQGGVTLTDSGRLRNSISARSNRQGVAVGTNLIYAGTHQFGRPSKGSSGVKNSIRASDHSTGSGHPQRAFLGISTADMAEIQSIIKMEIDKAIE